MRTAVFLLLLWSLLLPLCCGLSLSFCNTTVRPLDVRNHRDIDHKLCLGWWNDAKVEYVGNMKGFVRAVADNCYEKYGKGNWSTNIEAVQCTIQTVGSRDCTPTSVITYGKEYATSKLPFKYEYPFEPVCEYYRERIMEEKDWKNTWNTGKFADLDDCRKFNFECQIPFDKKKPINKDDVDTICDIYHEAVDSECPTTNVALEQLVKNCTEQQTTSITNSRRECVLHTIYQKCDYKEQETMKYACQELTPETNCELFAKTCLKQFQEKSPKSTTSTTATTTTESTPFTTQGPLETTVTTQESTTTVTATEPTTSGTTPSTTSFDPTTTSNDTTTTEVITTTEPTRPTTTPSSITTEPTTVTTVPTTVETTTESAKPDTTTASTTTRSTSTTTTTEDTRIYTKKPEVEDGLDAVRRQKALEAKKEGKKDEEEGTNLTALWVCLGLGVAASVGVGVVVFFVVRRKLKKKKEEAGKAGKKAVAATKNPFAPSKRPPGPRPTPSVMESGTTEGFRNDGVLTVAVAIWKNKKMEHATGDDEGKLIENVEDVIFDATMNRIVAIGSDKEQILTEEAPDFTVGAPAKEEKKSEVKSVAKPDAGP